MKIDRVCPACKGVGALSVGLLNDGLDVFVSCAACNFCDRVAMTKGERDDVSSYLFGLYEEVSKACSKASPGSSGHGISGGNSARVVRRKPAKRRGI